MINGRVSGGIAAFVVLTALGCSGAGPTNEPIDESVSQADQALRPGRDASNRPEILLFPGSDGAIHRLTTAGRDEGVLAQVTNRGTLSGIALDRFGNVYVSNWGDGTIHAYTAAGGDLGVFASTGLSVTYALALDHQGNLFVAEGDNAIHKFSADGEPLGLAASLMGLGCPAGVAFDRSDNLFVSDICGSVIRKYSPTGEYLGIFAASGLSNPGALAFDDRGNLFVANTDNGGPFRNTVRKFSATGADLGSFASAGLHFPSGLAFNARGELLVSNGEQEPDSTAYSIHRFSAKGESLGALAVLPFAAEGLVVAAPTRGCGH